MGSSRSQHSRPETYDVPVACSPARRAPRLLVTALMTGVLVLSAAPSADAAKSDRTFPSRDEVARAQQRATDKARDVGAIKASLLLANQRLEAAAVEAERASEAYNGAMWRLEEARQELADARAEAARARRTVEKQRDAIGRLVARSYQSGGQLNAITAFVDADGPESVMDQYATFQGVSSSLQADYDRFAASETIAQGFEQRAEEASAKAKRLADEARAAKEEATSAAAAAQTAAAQIADEKDRLIRELARAQDISVSLARQRQEALEEIARKRAEARARAEAAEAARQQALEDARRRAEARRESRREARKQARAEAARQAREKSRAQQSDTPKPTPPPPASPPPAPAPPPPSSPPSGSGGADRAIAFARSQLGDPYVWGAAGPDAWDCSGLMLQAWAQAGVSLPHYSVAQYYAGTPISASDLRPGDLVFWGTTSSPGSIHHVAMYLGGGMIIHAPRTGRPVSIDSMYYWIPPNFFARV